jgi:chromosome segregation ATPase
LNVKNIDPEVPMSEENTDKVIEDGPLTGEALLQAMRRDMQGLFGAFKALDQKVESRLHDTRPMWEAVVSRLDAIEAEQKNQGKRLDAIEGRLDAIEVTLQRFDVVEGELRQLRRRIEGMIAELSRDVVEVRAAQRDLEDRLEKLEKPAV